MLAATKVTVTTTPTLLAAGQPGPPPNRNSLGAQVSILNKGPEVVYVGGSGVTVADGYPLGDEEAIGISPLGDDVYAVTASATAEVRVLRMAV